MTPVSGKAASVLEQLEERATRIVLTVDGYKLSVTNLDKVLWPGSGRRPLTKRDLLRYLARVSPWLLPHLKGRPMFVTRLLFQTASAGHHLDAG